MGKHICFIGAGLKGGGQERGLSSLANYLSHKGYQVTIINLFKTVQFYEIDERINVYWPGIRRSSYHRLTYALLILPYLRKTVRKVNPDVLLSFGEWFNPFVIFSTRFMGYPLFVLDRMGPHMKLDPMINLARKLFYKAADGVIVQTNAAANIILERIKVRRIAVIPNPVNVINAVPSVKKKQIVTVGRLSGEKGQIILIRAFAGIVHKDWTLHIVGDGPDRSVLEKEASSLGVGERVIFYGHMKDFSQVLGESEIFALPSFYEGFPNSLIEAMSVPLPCISSNCVAGPDEIIHDGINGLLVEPGNVEALESAINVLIATPDLRAKLAQEAYKVRETLSFEKISHQYLDFIFVKHD